MASYGGESDRFIMWLKWISTKTTTNQRKLRFFCPFQIYGMIEAGAHTSMPPEAFIFANCAIIERRIYLERFIHFAFCMFSDSVLFSYWFLLFGFLLSFWRGRFVDLTSIHFVHIFAHLHLQPTESESIHMQIHRYVNECMFIICSIILIFSFSKWGCIHLALFICNFNK